MLLIFGMKMCFCIENWLDSMIGPVICGQRNGWERFSSVHTGHKPPGISIRGLNRLFSYTVVYCTLYTSSKKTLHTIMSLGKSLWRN